MVALLQECLNDSMLKDKEPFSLFFNLVAKEWRAVKVFNFVGIPGSLPIRFSYLLVTRVSLASRFSFSWILSPNNQNHTLIVD